MAFCVRLKGQWLSAMLQPQAKTPLQIEHEERVLARRAPLSALLFLYFSIISIISLFKTKQNKTKTTT